MAIPRNEGGGLQKFDETGVSHTAARMAGAYYSGVLADGVQVDIDMRGAPLPCALYLDPISGDTLQAWYSPDADKSRMVSIATTTVYYESAQLTGSVAWIRVQRTAGTGTTSKATVR